jgi:TRAP-type C4-dicarboxylate transport system permease small subunit
VYGLGVTGALAGAVYLLLIIAPNGIVWGPVVSLSCMLWVGFLGASMATYERRHLALEMGEKLWRGKALTVVRALAWLSAAGVCLFLLSLSVLSISEHHDAWALNHLAGNLLPTGIPKWVVFLIFPYTFVVMTLRFVAQSVGGEADATEGKPA